MPTRRRLFLGPLAALGLLLVAAVCPAAEDRGPPWPCHVIDNSSRGADGTRLADANGDGRPDIVTGWEEGGTVRVYLHPGPEAVRRPWPAVTVGPAPDVEDAVFVDLDADGALDVVTCCEGRTRTVFVHWAPREKAHYMDPSRWKTEPIPASAGRMMWMFALPMQVDGQAGVDLLAGAKNAGAQVGWFRAPPDPRRLADWTWHPLSEAGWIMSLAAADVDGDGRPDILLSDRYGPLRGCRWLRAPGPGDALAGPWENRFIGGRDREAMFLALADLDGDGRADIVNMVKDKDRPGTFDVHRRTGPAPDAWETRRPAFPAGVGTGKGVAVGDVDLDGRPDIVFSCEGAKAPLSGVVWLSPPPAGTQGPWTAHEISGPRGTKFDLVVLLDLDGDGDLDVLTCEEAENLGLVWYENPARGAPPPP